MLSVWVIVLAVHEFSALAVVAGTAWEIRVGSDAVSDLKIGHVYADAFHDA